MIAASEHALEATTPRVLFCLSSDMSAALSWQTMFECDIKLRLYPFCLAVLTRDLGLRWELWEEEEMWFFRWFLRPPARLCDTEGCRVSCSCWGEAAKAPLGSAASGEKGSCRCWCSITCNTQPPAFAQHLRAPQVFLKHQVWKAGEVKGFFTHFENVHLMYIALGSCPTLSHRVLLWMNFLQIKWKFSCSTSF